MVKIALIGKPNVGKSSLFNRILGFRKAIVDDQFGVTRDRNYATAEWLGKSFEIIDTGGLVLNDEFSSLQEIINQQINYAINDANIILFIVSAKEGINKFDLDTAKLLKLKAKEKKIILVVNKAENYDHSQDKAYFNLKFGKFYLISCSHGIGIGDLLDYLVEQIEKFPLGKQVNSYKFCIIGRTNVGKSSLVNAILNQPRVIVSNQDHTTRDSIDCQFRYHNDFYTIIDTAGIKRKGKITSNVDKYSYLKTQQAIARSQLAIILLDGSQEFNEQDEIIAGLAFKANIPIIIVVNKYDLIKKNQISTVDITKEIKRRFVFLNWVPIIFISAKTKYKLNNIFLKINHLQNQLKIKISSSALNNVLIKAQILNPSPIYKGNRLKITYATQVKATNPTFVLFTNNPKHLHFSYARYIENQIRKNFGLLDIPITIYYKDKNSRIRK